MKMIKKTSILLPILLLLMGQEAWAEKIAQVMVTTDKTMYFVYDEPITVGNTYQSKTVSRVWSGDDVVNSGSPKWDDVDAAKACTKVVFDASFASVRPKTCMFWFLNFFDLQEIEGLQYLNTSEVTDMYNMFAKCSSLTTLDVTSFDTQQVTNMNGMFQDCVKLTTLNLASFDTKNVTDMGCMFKGCQKLTTIEVSASWTTTNVDTSSDMFQGCTLLKGGNNTAYDANYTNRYYARIDRADAPGYLTESSTVLLMDDADNSGTLTTYNGQTKTVRLMGRTLYKNGSWSTICLPFDLKDNDANESNEATGGTDGITFTGTPLQGAVVKKLSSSTYDAATGTLTLEFSDATNISAGHPYLIKWSSGSPLTDKDLVFTGVTIHNNANDKVCVIDDKRTVTLKGSYKKISFDTDDRSVFILGDNNTFSNPTSGATLGALRAYFTLVGPFFDMGDVNGDGKIDISDVVALVNIILKGNSDYNANADMNKDGVINISDVVLLVNNILNKNTDLKVKVNGAEGLSFGLKNN